MKKNNLSTKLFLALGFVLIFASLSSGATYYMRSDGTASSGSPPTAPGPCGTVGNTLNEANFNASTFSSGDLILLCDDGGDYTSEFTLGSGHAGITLQPASGDTVTIDVGSGASQAINLDANADNVTIDGNDTGMPYSASPPFVIKGGTGQTVDIDAGADGITLQYLHIISTESGTNYDAIEVGGTDGSIIRFNKIEDDGPYSAADETGRDGISTEATGAANDLKIYGNYFIDFGHDAVNTYIGDTGFMYIYWNHVIAPNRGYCRAFGIDANGTLNVYLFENLVDGTRIGTSLQNHDEAKIWVYNNIILNMGKCCYELTGSCVGVEISDWGEGCDEGSDADGQIFYSDKGDYGEPAIELIRLYHNTIVGGPENFFKSNNWNVADESGVIAEIINNVAQDLFQEVISGSGVYHYQKVIAVKNNSASPQYEWALTVQNNIFEDTPAPLYDVYFEPDDSQSKETDWTIPTTKNSNTGFNIADDSPNWTLSTIDDNYKTELDLDSHGQPLEGNAVIDYGQTGLSITDAPVIDSVTHGVNIGIEVNCLNYSQFALSIQDCMVARGALPWVGAYQSGLTAPAAISGMRLE